MTHEKDKEAAIEADNERERWVLRRFRVTYRSALIDPKREHVCEGLEHSDGQVYLQGYTDEKLFESREAMVQAVLLPQDYAFLSIEWLDLQSKGGY